MGEPIHFRRVPAWAYARLARLCPRPEYLSPEARDSEALEAMGAECFAAVQKNQPLACAFYIVSGDLRGLFNGTTFRALGVDALHFAESRGARTLDCFDGFLPSFYARHGWRETGRAPFDPAQAPASWPASNGAPDVVFMARERADVRCHCAGCERGNPCLAEAVA